MKAKELESQARRASQQGEHEEAGRLYLESVLAYYKEDNESRGDLCAEHMIEEFCKAGRADLLKKALKEVFLKISVQGTPVLSAGDGWQKMLDHGYFCDALEVLLSLGSDLPNSELYHLRSTVTLPSERLTELPEEALELLTECYRRTKSQEGLSWVAKIWGKKGNVQKAKQVLDMRIGPKDGTCEGLDDGQGEIIWDLVKSEAVEDAVQLAENILDSSTPVGDCYARGIEHVALLLVRDRHIDRAVDLLTELYKNWKGSRYCIPAKMYELMGRTDKAISTYEISGRSEKASRLRGTPEFAIWKREKAKQLLSEIRRVRWQAELNVLIGVDDYTYKQMKANVKYEEDSLVRLVEMGTSIDTLEDLTTLCRLVDYLELKEQYFEAIRCLERIAKLESTGASKTRLARLYHGSGQHKRCVNLLRENLGLKPMRSFVSWKKYGALAAIYKNAGDMISYQGILDEAEKYWLSYGEWHHPLCLYFHEELYDDFDRLWKQVDEPEFAAALYEAAEMPERAAGAYEYMIRRGGHEFPEIVDAFCRCHEKLGTQEQAAKLLEEMATVAKPRGLDSEAPRAQVGQRSCRECGKEIDGDSKFCMHCGTELADRSLKCPKCNVMLPPKAKFCKRCGTKIK